MKMSFSCGNVAEFARIRLEKRFRASFIENRKVFSTLAILMRRRSRWITRDRPVLIGILTILVGLILPVTYGCKSGTDIRDNVEAIKSDDPDVRREAIMAIGEKRDPRAVKVVAAVLKGDPDRLVRSAAAEALGKIGSHWATPHLIKALRDREYIVRWDAAKALGELRDEAALPRLIGALRNDSNERVRAAAISAITKIAQDSPEATHDAVKALIEALKDRSESIVLAASIGLSELTGQNLGVDRGAWLKWWKANKDAVATNPPKKAESAAPDGISPTGEKSAETPDQLPDKANP